RGGDGGKRPEREDHVAAITLECHAIQIRDFVADMREACYPRRVNGLLNRALGDVERVVLTSEAVLGQAPLEFAVAAAERQHAIHGSAAGKILLDEVLEPVPAVRAAAQGLDPVLH